MLSAKDMDWLTGEEVGAAPGRRTKASHPYSYDPFTIWRGKGTADGSVYTDRLFSWGPEKHDRLCEKHFGDSGQHWAGRAPEAIEAFLRDYLEAPQLQVCEIHEHCNVGNGFPCWYLAFRKVPGE